MWGALKLEREVCVQPHSPSTVSLAAWAYSPAVFDTALAVSCAASVQVLLSLEDMLAAGGVCVREGELCCVLANDSKESRQAVSDYGVQTSSFGVRSSQKLLSWQHAVCAVG